MGCSQCVAQISVLPGSACCLRFTFSVVIYVLPEERSANWGTERGATDPRLIENSDKAIWLV